jgi:hypothetical protein
MTADPTGPVPTDADADAGATGAGAEAAAALPGVTEDGGQPNTLNQSLIRSARTAGTRAVASGRWLAETVLDLAARAPIRDAQTLTAQHPDLIGDRSALAAALIRTAARASASVGAATGAAMAAEELLPPAWITLPFEVAAETAVVAAIEVKLIGELHELYGRPVPGVGRQRAFALARAWAERRGVTPATLAGGVPALTESLGRGTRDQVIRLVRRRLIRRAGANLTSAAPFLLGAAAGAAVNRRSTLHLGHAVVDDLTGV